MPSIRAFNNNPKPSQVPYMMETRLNTPKRRKVRKGTQSCWECKRRKIRCTFATPRNSICDGCKSRRTKCIGQEYEDETAQENAVADQPSCGSPVGGLTRQGNDRRNPTKAKCNVGPKRNISASTAVAPSSDLGNSDFEGISRALILEWPNQSDLDLILSVPVGISALLHGLICRPYEELFAADVPSARDVLQPPPEGMHPVLAARKLLLLATFLQSVPTSAASTLAGTSLGYRSIMSRVFNAATRLVTTNDELTTTLEGIECVMIESMYLNNAGNLRRAWLANRRAMGIAQMMGLHVNATSRPIVVLERETQDRIGPQYMWFRLVVSDRYLSLMLGLPQGTIESSFAEPKILDGCTPLERMERMESVAASLILHRKYKERIDPISSQKIDTMLRDAAALMPPQWWLVDTKLTSIAGDSAKALEESVRLTTQFAHYHLLAQLHLPYILLPSLQELNYDYNKMIAANSSREVLMRFVAYRSSNSTPAYCRGIDFISFIASTTLCLAHMQAMRPQGIASTCTTFQSLQHQRLSDRGLLERTLEIMETMALENDDVVARKISSILRPLLAIESNSLKGGCYHISVSAEAYLREPQSMGDADEGVSGVRIQIPYFGTIKIEHRPALSEQAGSGSRIATTIDRNLVVLGEPASMVDCITSGDGYQEAQRRDYEYTIGQSVNTDWQTLASFSESTGPINPNGGLVNSGTTGSKNKDLPAPSLAVDLDDWVLQGVDMALFSSLTAGDIFDFTSHLG